MSNDSVYNLFEQAFNTSVYAKNILHLLAKSLNDPKSVSTEDIDVPVNKLLGLNFNVPSTADTFGFINVFLDFQKVFLSYNICQIKDSPEFLLIYELCSEYEKNHFILNENGPILADIPYDYLSF